MFFMNKFFLVLIVLSHNMYSMDAKNLVMRSTAALAGAGSLYYGATLSTQYGLSTMKEYDTKKHSTGAARADADSTCFGKVAAGCLLRGTSYAAANLLLSYAFKGNLPSPNARTYISSLLIASGGIAAQLAHVAACKAYFEHGQSNIRNILSWTGLGLVGVGMYGFCTNK